MREEFMSGHDVTVSGFGSFKVKTRAAREARNPKTGESVHVDEQRTVTFKPVAQMKKDLNTK
jgi:nucleoid DNA-binding protein